MVGVEVRQDPGAAAAGLGCTAKVVHHQARSGDRLPLRQPAPAIGKLGRFATTPNATPAGELGRCAPTWVAWSFKPARIQNSTSSTSSSFTGFGRVHALHGG